VFSKEKCRQEKALLPVFFLCGKVYKRILYNLVDKGDFLWKHL